MRTGHAVETYGRLLALTTNPVTWAWAAALAAALVALPWAVSGHLLVVSTTVLIATVGVVGLNVLTGTTGLISLGQSGFLAIGGYACGLLIRDLSLPTELAIPLAGLITGTLSLLIGVPSLRLKGLYLAITTLAASLIVIHIILYAEPLTGGPFGLRIPDVSFLGLRIADGRGMYYIALIVAVLTVVFVNNLMRSRSGRAWIALRDHDIAAKSMGIDLVRYKLLSFFVSSSIVGVAGALMALQLRFITADVFGLFLSIEALAMLLVGGVGSVAGAILGATFIVLLPEIARGVLALVGWTGETGSAHVFEIRAVVTGVLIIVMLRIEPDGLIGIWRRTKRYWLQWPLSV